MRPHSARMVYTEHLGHAELHQQDPVAVVTKEILREEEQENGLEMSVTTVTPLSSALEQAQYLLKPGGLF